MSDWTTNASLGDIAGWLKSVPRVAVLTHGKPDGDAIGSTAAIVRALNHGQAGHNARAWYVGPMPGWTGSVAGGTGYRIVEENGLPEQHEADAVLICDTGSRGQIEGYGEFVPTDGFGDRGAIVDHHLQGDGDLAGRRHIATTAAAACEPIAELCTHVLGVSSARDLPSEVATPLYLGLATDTGWFRHSNVTPGTLRLAADLLEAGAEHARLFRAIEQQDRASRVRLLGAALSKMQLRCGDRIAILPISMADFHAAKAGPGDTGGFADSVLSIRGVLVSVVLTEVEATATEPARVKLSFRSKSGREIVNVNEVAGTFGGGGHAQAAGARFEGSLDGAVERVIAALEPAVEAIAKDDA